MPPEERFVCRFAAEPPQDLLPYGRWETTLRDEFLAAVERIAPGDGDELGEPGDLTWFPDRSWNGTTFVPVTSRTSTEFELFGYVAFERDERGEPTGFRATADYTGETSDRNPDWQVDLCEEVVGIWRGENQRQAQMTLVWGVPLVKGTAVATAELANLAVDQCVLIEGRFTLIAPDDYRGDFLEIILWDRGLKELARESLYEDDDD
jgi:hypothetical protein